MLTLKLTAAQTAVLYGILSNIGGHPATTMRGHVDGIIKQIEDPFYDKMGDYCLINEMIRINDFDIFDSEDNPFYLIEMPEEVKEDVKQLEQSHVLFISDNSDNR